MNILKTSIFKKVKQKSKKNANFIIECLKELEENDFEIKVFRGKTPEGYGGYFSHEDREFVISIPKLVTSELHLELFVGLFAHEFCHYTQWKNNIKIYHNYDKARDYTRSDLITKDLSKDIEIIRKLEIDCERRVVKLIDNGTIDLDREFYIKSANCYIAYHDVLHITRAWGKKSVTKQKSLRDLVPGDKLIKNINCLGENKPEFIIRTIKKVY